MVSVDPLIVVVAIPVVIGVTAGILMYQTTMNTIDYVKKNTSD